MTSDALSPGPSATPSETALDTGYLCQNVFHLVLDTLLHQLLIQGPGWACVLGGPGHMLAIAAREAGKVSMCLYDGMWGFIKQ